MNIAATQFTLETSSFEIYISGCDGHCGRLCHNKEIWDFTLGEDYRTKLDKTIEKIRDFDNLIEWIWILGGEPLLQNENELVDMLQRLKKTGKPIMLLTRFELNEISPKVLSYCDYVKTGKYDPSQPEESVHYGVHLATANQKIIKL